jgi:hypothetical protein
MKERRRKSRNSTPVSADVTIAMVRAGGELKTRQVRLVDVGEWGLGFNTSQPMVVGAKLWVWGPALIHAPDEARKTQVQVVHCRLVSEDGVYRTGCSYESAPRPQPGESKTKADSSLLDLYEVLQISPSADSDTIHRVYRYLAQRYHPDNPDTGDSNAFQAVLQAHQVLSDPERRAAYDLEYQASKSLRWKIFHKPSGAEGVAAEKSMRAGILSALYAKKKKEPDGQGMMLREIEDLLACPREHMQFPLWYLRRKGLVLGPDNGRYEISIEGVDEAERLEEQGYGPQAASYPLIEAAQEADSTPQS